MCVVRRLCLVLCYGRVLLGIGATGHTLGQLLTAHADFNNAWTIPLGLFLVEYDCLLSVCGGNGACSTATSPPTPLDSAHRTCIFAGRCVSAEFSLQYASVPAHFSVGQGVEHANEALRCWRQTGAAGPIAVRLPGCAGVRPIATPLLRLAQLQWDASYCCGAPGRKRPIAIGPIAMGSIWLPPFRWLVCLCTYI